MTVTFDKVRAGEYLAKTRFGTFSIQSGSKGHWYVSEPGLSDEEDWTEVEYSLKEAKEVVDRKVNRNILAENTIAAIDPPLKAGEPVAWSPYFGTTYFGTFHSFVRSRGEQKAVVTPDGAREGHTSTIEVSRIVGVRGDLEKLREEQAEKNRVAAEKAGDDHARQYLHEEADHRVLEAVRAAIDRGGVEGVIAALDAVPARFRFDDLVTLHHWSGDLVERVIFRRYEDDGRVTVKAAENDWEFTVPADSITRGWDDEDEDDGEDGPPYSDSWARANNQ